MNLAMAIAALGAAVVVVVFFVRCKSGIFGISRKAIALALVLKLLAGAALYIVYTKHYTHRGTSDSFRYFDDAMTLNSYLGERNDVWFRFMFGANTNADDLRDVNAQLRAWQTSTHYGIANDNPAIIRINMIIGLFSGEAYLLHVFWMSIMALFGHLFLARGLTDLVDRGGNAVPIFAGSLLFPTVVFWGSGVLKEVPLILGLGMLFFALSGSSRHDWKRWLWMPFALWLLAFSKPYVWITLAAPLAAFIVVRSTSLKPYFAFPVILALAYFGAIHADAIYKPGDLLYILAKKQTDFYNVAELQDAGSTVAISPVSQSAIGFLIDAPERLAITYLRPWPLEASGSLQWAAVVENLLLLVAFGWMVAVWWKMGRQMDRRISSMVWLVITFAFVFGLVAGSTVPVLGAIVRYKLPVLLLFGSLTGLIARQRFTYFS